MHYRKIVRETLQVLPSENSLKFDTHSCCTHTFEPIGQATVTVR